MKKIYLLLIVLISICNSIISQGQIAKKPDIDVLRAPSSPAANLIGISPSLIEKPSDPTALMVSIRNATNNFSQIPESYAIDIAPAWVFDGKKITINSFANRSIKKIFWQSLVISSAITNNIDDEDTISNSAKAAFGLKFSLARGNRFTSDYNNHVLDSAVILFDSILYNSFVRTDIKYQDIKSKMGEFVKNGGSKSDGSYLKLQRKAQKRLSDLKDKAYEIVFTKQSVDTLRKNAEGIKLARFGFKSDISLGVVFDFPDQQYNNGSLTKFGTWVTAGWDLESGLSILGIGRFLYNPDKIFADDEGVLKSKNIQTFDAGARLAHTTPGSKFLISAEGLYRSVLNSSEVKSSYRYTINIEYDIQNNTKLTFSFGRDFDGTITKDGNVIAALNFIKGFGTIKK